MGALIAGAIGGIGSLIGGSSSKSASKAAAQQSLTGYNYLTNPNTGVGSVIKQGTAANTAAGDLLGVNGAEGQARSAPAFQNYLGSTGYNFQMDQGSRAITGNTASKGLLNSGATAKALTSYGQGLASQSFGNYLNQLNQQTTQGLTASGQVGAAGTGGGANAASATMNGANANANGVSTAFNQVGSAIGNNWSGITNFLGGI